jgi:hypothetical protein
MVSAAASNLYAGAAGLGAALFGGALRAVAALAAALRPALLMLPMFRPPCVNCILYTASRIPSYAYAPLRRQHLIAQNLRAARANRVFGTDKKHPYQKHGYG